MIRYLIVLLMMLAACKQRFEASESDLHSASHIPGPNYDQILQDLRDLQSRHADRVQLVEYGRSVRDRPLVAVEMKLGPGRPPPKRAILIQAAVHGEEFMNIVHRLPGDLVNIADEVSEPLVVYVVPIFNPDAFERPGDVRTRTNYNMVDLNRDYDSYSLEQRRMCEPETNQFRDYLDKALGTKQLVLVVDYHCCSPVGYLLHPWTYTNDQPPHNELLATIGTLFKSHLSEEFKFGRSQDLLGYADLSTNNGIGKDYYFDKYGALSYTFEGLRHTEHERYAAHSEVWQKIAKMTAAGEFDHEYALNPSQNFPSACDQFGYYTCQTQGGQHVARLGRYYDRDDRYKMAPLERVNGRWQHSSEVSVWKDEDEPYFRVRGAAEGYPDWVAIRVGKDADRLTMEFAPDSPDDPLHRLYQCARRADHPD